MNNVQEEQENRIKTLQQDLLRVQEEVKLSFVRNNSSASKNAEEKDAFKWSLRSISPSSLVMSFISMQTILKQTLGKKDKLIIYTEPWRLSQACWELLGKIITRAVSRRI